jgi:hypothetical protein
LVYKTFSIGLAQVSIMQNKLFLLALTSTLALLLISAVTNTAAINDVDLDQVRKDVLEQGCATFSNGGPHRNL